MRAKRIGRYEKGRNDHLFVADARKKAREVDPRREIASEETGTMRAVAEQWFKDHVLGQRLKSATELRRHLDGSPPDQRRVCSQPKTGTGQRSGSLRG